MYLNRNSLIPTVCNNALPLSLFWPQELTERQSELDKLTAKSESLSREVAGSELRQECWRLHQQLGEVTARRDEWRLKEKETPEVSVNC